jgi:SAM-dependent methyltransferase
MSRFKLILKTLLRMEAQDADTSETSKCRDYLTPFCSGAGLDIGYGGDPIVPTAICLDLPERYARYNDYPQHLHGNAQSLYWFTDECLDYVYSSHVLEDFEDTRAVLDEWLRVIRPGGHLILYLPDEQTYRSYCYQQGKPPNIHHIHDNFSLDYIKKCLSHRDDFDIVHERFPVGIYSFELVLRKNSPCPA